MFTETSNLNSVLLDERIAFRVHHNKLFFQDPERALTSKQLNLLRENQGAILQRLALRPPLQDKTVQTENRDFRLSPLAFQQESALLYREPNFFTVHAVRMRGPLNVDILSKSLTAIAQRHSALRSTVIVVDGVLMQKVELQANIGFSVNTVDDADARDVESRASEMIVAFVTQWLAEARRTFEARLIILGKADCVLAVTLDHIFSDYTSDRIIFREMWTTYGDLLQRKASSLANAPMQYDEYARRQRDNYSQWLKLHSPFWIEHLSGVKSLQLRPDAGHRVLEPLKDRTLSVSLGIALSAGVQQLAQNEKVLPSLVVFAACATLLSAWSGQRQFVIPFYVYGRHTARQLQVAGYLAHPLPLRIDLHGGEPFIDLLNKVFTEFMSASQHLSNGKSLAEAPNPFECPLIQWFDSRPDPCDALVPSLEDMKRIEPDLSVQAFPIDFSAFQDPTGWDHVPLALWFWNSPQGIEGGGLYRSDLFAPTTVRRFMNDLRSALASVVSDPLISISKLSEHR